MSAAEDNPLAAALGLAIAETEAETTDVEAPVVAVEAGALSQPRATTSAVAAVPKRPELAAQPAAASQVVKLERSAFAEPTAGQEAGGDEEGAGGGGGGTGGGGGGGGGDEFFGIAYQSTRRKKGDYQVPSGPAFADEREFEKELRASAVNDMATHTMQQAGANDDDEFDHEFDFEAGPATVAPSIAEIRRRREELARKQAEEEQRLIEAMKQAAPGDAAGSAAAAKKATAAAASTTSSSASAAGSAGEVALGKANALKAVQAQLKADAEAARAAEVADHERRFEEQRTDLRATMANAIMEEGDEEEEEEDEEDSEDEAAALAAAQADVEAAKADAALAAAQLYDDNHPTPSASAAAVGVGAGAGGGAGAGVGAFAAPATALVTAAGDDMDDELRREHDEWDRVANVSATVREAKFQGVAANSGGRQAVIKYPEMYCELFEKRDLSEQLATVSVTEPTAGCMGMCGPPALDGPAVEQKQKIFATAATPMNMADETHYRMLQSLYKGLAGGDLDCPLPSNNWVEIGFQGSDPIRDLRGCGMLSIFATLSFLHTHKDFVHSMLRKSHMETSDFPFMATSIKMTSRSLAVLESGKLNAIAKAKGGSSAVVDAFLDYYKALFFKWFALYTDGPHTIEDFLVVDNQSTSYCSGNPGRAMADFRAAMAKDVWSTKAQRGEGAFAAV